MSLRLPLGILHVAWQTCPVGLYQIAPPCAAGDSGAVGGTHAGAVRTPRGGLPGAREYAAARGHAGGRYRAALSAGCPGRAGRASSRWVFRLCTL